MESGNHQIDDGQLNIQNDYFNTARKNRTRVTVVLTTGQRLSGLIRSFDRFTLILDTRHGDQMVFKHAIATVAPAAALEAEQRHRPPRPGERGEGRPRGPGGRPSQGGPPRERPAGDRPAGGPVRERAVRGPEGKTFGNFMDLSAVSGSPEKAAEAASARPAQESRPVPAPAPAAEPAPAHAAGEAHSEAAAAGAAGGGTKEGPESSS